MGTKLCLGREKLAEKSESPMFSPLRVLRATGAGRRLSSVATAPKPIDRYLFDLNGFLVLRGVFSEEQVSAANKAIDAHIDGMHERTGKLMVANAYGVKGGALKGDGTGRFDLGGMLSWPSPHRDVFRAMLCHEALVPYYHMMLGAGYRLDHLPFLIRMIRGSEGHAFHGGAVQPSGEPSWPLAYSHNQGQIRCSLLAVALQLSDTNAGDGGFCILPGSHKSNFAPPPEVLAYEEATEAVVQPVLKKGDVVFFTEAATHGTLPWRSDTERRTVLYRFAPSGSAYGRNYLDGLAELDGLTEAEAAVLQPPFHTRLDRPTLNADGTLKPAAPREQYKKDFDKKVFGKAYF